MSVYNLTCVECPMGCAITVEKNGDEIKVSGNNCPRGKAYAEAEITCPMRVLTTSVRCTDGRVLPVKTDAPIKKSEMMDIMKTINAFVCPLPAKIGDILIANVSDGANVVATDNLE